MPVTTASPARMLPCAVQNFPRLWPAHSLAFGPVNAAISPFGVDHGELAARAWSSARVADRDRSSQIALMIAAGAIPALQQRNRLRPVADVDDGLRGRGADAGFGPQHAVADREHARLHRAADFAGGRVVAEDREGRHRIGQLLALLRDERRRCAATPPPRHHRHHRRHAPRLDLVIARSSLPSASVVPAPAWHAASATSAIDTARSVRAPSCTGVQPCARAAADLLVGPAALRADRQRHGRRRAAAPPAGVASTPTAGLDQQQPQRRLGGRRRSRRTSTGWLDRRDHGASALLRRGHRDARPARATIARVSAASRTSDRAETNGRTCAAPIITASRIDLVGAVALQHRRRQRVAHARLGAGEHRRPEHRP